MSSVPRPLKHLTQKVLRGFYPIEHVIVVDILVRRRLVKEDEIMDLLKFERKQLRSILAQLRNDKLIKFKLRMETGLDGKTQRQHYYFINYKAFVNVVKYKLDHMRKKIELEERDLTSRASFICSQDLCHKTFTDLEVDHLLDISTGEFRCSFCGGEVKEDPNHMPKADSRLMLAKFNQMTEPLWVLLKDVEDIRLTPDLLEPEIEVKSATGSQSSEAPNTNGMNAKQWKDDKNRSINNGYESMVFSEQQNLSVKIEDINSVNINNGHHEQEQVVVKKEQPAWMTESTVTSSVSESLTPSSNGVSKGYAKVLPKMQLNSFNDVSNSEPSKEILETLLIHEKQQENYSAASLLFSDSKNEAENLEDNDLNEDSIMSDEEDEIESHTPMIKVGNRLFSLTDIDNKIIAQMSEYEKDEYIRLTQQVYAHMYD